MFDFVDSSLRRGPNSIDFGSFFQRSCLVFANPEGSLYANPECSYFANPEGSHFGGVQFLAIWGDLSSRSPNFCHSGGVPIQRGPTFVNPEGSQLGRVLFLSNHKGPNSEGSYFCQLGGVTEIYIIFNERNRSDHNTTYVDESKIQLISIKILRTKQINKYRKPVTALVTCL